MPALSSIDRIAAHRASSTDSLQPELLERGIQDINNAVRVVSLCHRLISDCKAVAKRTADSNGEWPKEIRDFMRYVRELSDSIETKHPEIMR